MDLYFDDKNGRAVGSVIGMSGRMLGLKLSLEEVVTERTVPARKVWETIGAPRLLVIGAYRMGFEIAPRGGSSAFTVFIEYDPPKGAWALLGWLFGAFYARWCVSNMTEGVAAHFRNRR